MLDITFRNLDSTPTIWSLANELMTKLAHNHGEPAQCRLVLEDTLGAHAHSASRFSTHLELSLGHTQMGFESHSSSPDASSAVRTAFERIERQLERFAGRRARQHHDVRS